MKTIQTIAYVLLIIGGLNWLLVGLVGWDIGAWLGGSDALTSRVIYILVGLSAIVQLFSGRKSSSATM